AAHGREAALDFSVKGEPQHWADKLGGRVLPTGSVRAVLHGGVAQLPGYGEGAWWVQDAAAALAARLLGELTGRTVAALCAAPGGILVYCTCSLEPEEGSEIVRDFLARARNFRRQPIKPGEAEIPADWLTPEGELRTLPCYLPDPDPAMAGLDGFYVARLER